MCNWYYSCSFAFLAKRDLVPEDLVARYTEGDRDKKIDAVLAPQVRIGPYRVDFLLAYRVNTQDSMWENKFVVVECDGHAFHERTKLQAAKDKARDRWLQHQGYKVLRFTGSEIWTNPYRCANEVLERAHTEMWESEGAVLLARAERDGEV
jgi:very-short-patch-repair endonuclease